MPISRWMKQNADYPYSGTLALKRNEALIHVSTWMMKTCEVKEASYKNPHLHTDH